MPPKKWGLLVELILVGVILLTGVVSIFCVLNKPRLKTEKDLDTATHSRFESFLEDNDLKRGDYPPELIDLLVRNPETEEFVLHYPLWKNKDFSIDLTDCVGGTSVPLLMQWDTRWGYRAYGNTVMGVSGCGPTCLSMVALYLLQDEKMDPGWMAEFSTKNGFCVPGNGTSWTLMSEGAEKLGLKATELPLDQNRILSNLQVGNPIICIMGEGDFTATGHFIVLTGCKDGRITVNDPNSRENSWKTWSYDQIKDQIRNLWVYTT